MTNTRFIYARVKARDGAQVTGNKHMLLLISGERFTFMVGDTFRSMRRIVCQMSMVDPHAGRYDDWFRTFGRTDEQLLKDMLMLGEFNGTVAVPGPTDGPTQHIPRWDYYYYHNWRTFTIKDLTSDFMHNMFCEVGELQRLDADDTSVRQTRVDCFVGDLEALIRNLYSGSSRYHRVLSVFRSKLNRLSGKPYLFNELVTDRSDLYPGSYRGFRITGYSEEGRQESTMRVRRNLAELGKQIRYGINDHDEYDQSELEDLLTDFCNKRATNGTTFRKQLMQRIQDMFVSEPDVEFCDCGHIEISGETQQVEGDTWCRNCTDEDAVWAVDTEEYLRRDNAYYSEIQSEWYSYDYDEENREDEDEDQDEDEPDGIMNYSTNALDHLSPDNTIKSSQFGNFLMGVEFELCSGSDSKADAVDKVRDDLGRDYCIIKSDGSLPSDGFEIVTAPRGLAEHIQRFKDWEVDSRWRAWNTNACGLHVHIDSRAFSALTLGKFLMFINSSGNADFIRKLAGRHPLHDNQAQRYCAADHQELLADPVKAIKGKGTDRYRMVNCANLRPHEAERLGMSKPYNFDGRYNTIELRIFRASLKKERLLAQIEFSHAVVLFCRAASYRELTSASFLRWLKTADGNYPHLAKWYGVRSARNKGSATPAETACEDRSPEPA